MKTIVKLLGVVEINAGAVVRNEESGTLMMLAYVPREDGAYTCTAGRWILVSLDEGSSTWDNKFHVSAEEALSSASWEYYAESPEAAYVKKFKGKCDMPLCPGGGALAVQMYGQGIRMCGHCHERTRTDD